MNNRKIKILFVETNEIKVLDIPRALDELGYDVYKASLGIKAQGYHQEDCGKIIAAIDDLGIQYVITHDFTESIAQACFETGIVYIAWVYDAPQKELYTHYALYSSNYIFVFDKIQKRRMEELGIPHVYHVPLAVHNGKVQKALQEVTEARRKESETHDIAFVGQLYYMDNIQKVYQNMPDQIRNQVDDNMDACFLQWDDTVKLHGLMQPETVAYLGELDKHEVIEKHPYMTEQFFYEVAVLSRLLANRERVTILNTLAQEYDVAFYTFEKNISQLDQKVHVLPGVAYDYEVSRLYQMTKINLNITLHCIETGVCQRVFDVMSAGGFLISNYQKELAELFVPGEEIILYHNLEELREAVAYYLTHEEERERIARKGQEKVLRLHGYHGRLQRIMEIVTRQEQSRTESHIAAQRRKLTELANTCLETGDEQSMQRLYDTFTDPTYETTIMRTDELRIFREMLSLYRVEQTMGQKSFLYSVNHLEQAVNRYRGVKHALWRIEQSLREERQREAVWWLREHSTVLLDAWCIHANLAHKEETFVGLSEYLKEESDTDAIALLTYGLIWLPDNRQLLLQKASLCMELSLWQDALETLRLINQPSEEEQQVIAELESALQG